MSHIALFMDNMVGKGIYAFLCLTALKDNTVTLTVSKDARLEPESTVSIPVITSYAPAASGFTSGASQVTGRAPVTSQVAGGTAATYQASSSVPMNSQVTGGTSVDSRTANGVSKASTPDQLSTVAVSSGRVSADSTVQTTGKLYIFNISSLIFKVSKPRHILEQLANLT